MWKIMLNLYKALIRLKKFTHKLLFFLLNFISFSLIKERFLNNALGAQGLLLIIFGHVYWTVWMLQCSGLVMWCYLDREMLRTAMTIPSTVQGVMCCWLSNLEPCAGKACAHSFVLFLFRLIFNLISISFISSNLIMHVIILNLFIFKNKVKKRDC